MLFHAFSALSVGDAAAADLSDSAVLKCGILCGRFLGDASCTVTVGSATFVLSSHCALLLNTTHPVGLPPTVDSAKIYYIALKINHVDFLNFLHDAILSFPPDSAFLDCVQQSFGASAISASDAFNQRTDSMLSCAIQRAGAYGGSAENARIPLASLPSDLQQFYAALYQCMDDNLQNDLSVPLLASAAGCSVRQLNAQLKKHDACSALEFINRYRIERSKQYLLSTALTVTDIASLVGFKSIHYYSRVFKLKEGMSPQTFRANPKARLYAPLSSMK